MPMRLLSVNVGRPRTVLWRGREVRSAIWKKPVAGRRRVRRLNVDGDGQADLVAHGGEHRAVFVYQVESYRYWEEQLGRALPDPGRFGENLTVEGMADADVCVGDRYAVGSAVVEVTQPRVTCFKVGIRLDEPRMPALLTGHGRPGFYLRVLEEGDVAAGDEIVKVADGPERLSVEGVSALLYSADHDAATLRRAGRVARAPRRLARVVSPAARAGRGRRRRQQRAHRRARAAGVAGLSPVPRGGRRARDRRRPLARARGAGRRPARRPPPRPVRAAARPGARRRQAVRRRLRRARRRRRQRRPPAHAQLLAVGPRRRAAAAGVRQARRAGERRAARPRAPGRRARRRRSARRLLARSRRRRAGRARQRGDRRHAGARDARRAGGGGRPAPGDVGARGAVGRRARAEPWTLESLAGEVHVSRATLARRFADLVGEPPLTYLARWRMHVAAQRLKHSADPVDTIAHGVGYTSEFAFSRAFARHRGQPPGRYRRLARERAQAGSAAG